jgi:hypothetical protein
MDGACSIHLGDENLLSNLAKKPEGIITQELEA